MAKKKRNSKILPFKQEREITYNTAKPNRRARRLGIKPIEQEQEKPQRISKAEILNRQVQQAKEIQTRITPRGMTYGEYMEYLKEKRQQLEEKKNNLTEV
jgi:hypothetical protein